MREFPSPSPLLPEILALHGRWRPHRDAVICAEQRVSWAQFCADNHRFAHGLHGAGIAPGDRVGVFMSNGYPMVTALFGTLAAGACSVPLNTSVSDAALIAMLRDAGIRALVVSSDFRARFDALLPELPAGTLLLCDEPADGWSSFQTLCREQPHTAPSLDLDDEAPLNIIYSSGTTGLPKGILHTHRGRRDWAYDLAIALRYHGAARTLLCIGPVFQHYLGSDAVHAAGRRYARGSSAF